MKGIHLKQYYVKTRCGSGVHPIKKFPRMLPQSFTSLYRPPIPSLSITSVFECSYFHETRPILQHTHTSAQTIARNGKKSTITSEKRDNCSRIQLLFFFKSCSRHQNRTATGFIKASLLLAGVFLCALSRFQALPETLIHLPHGCNLSLHVISTVLRCTCHLFFFILVFN